MLTDDEKIKIANTAAKIVLAKYRHNKRLELTELQNIAFASIKDANDKKKAQVNAYFHALHFAHSFINKDTYKERNVERQVYISNLHQSADRDMMIDVRDAISKLSKEELQLIALRYVYDMKLQDIAKEIGMKSKSGVYYKMQLIDDKLRMLLEDYANEFV